MSYCRFSTNDYQCDVYCYHSVGDYFQIYVASNRPVYKEPLPPHVPWDSEHAKEFLERHKKVMAMLDEADREPIGLPYDGDEFSADDADGAADILEMLKKVGYNVPQFAIDALREEAKEEGDSNEKD